MGQSKRMIGEVREELRALAGLVDFHRTIARETANDTAEALQDIRDRLEKLEGLDNVAK